MKRLFSVFFIMLLLVSILPLAFADVDPVRSRAREIKDSIMEKKEVLTERVQQAKEVRESFVDAKRVFRAKCIQNGVVSDSAECQDEVVNIKEETQEYLLTFIEKLLAAIDKIKERVGASDVDDETKDRILTELGEVETNLLDLQDEVDGFTSETEWSEYKRVTWELRQKAVKLKIRIKKNHLHVFYVKLNHLITKLEFFSEKFNNILERMSGEGIDVSEIESMVDGYDGYVSSARENLDEARESWTSGDYDLVREQLRSAIDSAKEANQLRKEIMSAIREKLGEEEEEGINTELKEVITVKPVQTTKMPFVPIADAGGDLQ